jgi:hypothetical protein
MSRPRHVYILTVGERIPWLVTRWKCLVLCFITVLLVSAGFFYLSYWHLYLWDNLWWYWHWFSTTMYNMCIVMVSFIVEKTWLQQRKSMTFWKSLTTLILITLILCALIWRLSSNFYFNNIKSYLLHLSSFWFFVNFNAIC